MSHEARLRNMVKSIMPGGPASLSEFSSTAAINELICNWAIALGHGGHALSDLVKDIDDVIEDLQAFKTECLRQAGGQS
jgi:hypothetical protein